MSLISWRSGTCEQSDVQYEEFGSDKSNMHSLALGGRMQAGMKIAKGPRVRLIARPC
jgi:hypothetical protein